MTCSRVALPGYASVDTVYHDRQHTLDVTLTMARLCAGYERQVDPLWKLGAQRAIAGVVLALFHDVGYLRRSTDTSQRNGAEFTRTHVSRGIEFLRGYLPQIGLGDWVEPAGQVLHFTGYEVPFSELVLQDARDVRLGHLLGTADMITQMADRCYLEKCRDRLYPEFCLQAWRCRTAMPAPSRCAMPRASTCCATRRDLSPRLAASAWMANSTAPTATSRFCLTAVTRT